MYVHVFRSDGRCQLESVNESDCVSARSAAFDICEKCNLQNGDMAAFCTVRPNYNATLPFFTVKSYAVAVKSNTLYLQEYDYLNSKTFPASAEHMTAIGSA